MLDNNKKKKKLKQKEILQNPQRPTKQKPNQQDPESEPENEPEYDLTDRENKFRADTQHLINQCLTETAKIKQVLKTAKEVGVLMPYAKVFKELIPNIQEARKLLPNTPALPVANIGESDDQITKLKKSIMVRVKEFEGILETVNKLESSPNSFEILLEISGIISSSLLLLSGSNK